MFCIITLSTSFVVSRWSSTSSKPSFASDASRQPSKEAELFESIFGSSVSALWQESLTGVSSFEHGKIDAIFDFPPGSALTLNPPVECEPAEEYNLVVI